MPRNATSSCEALTSAQEKALAAWLTGKSVTDAASAAVDRTTVHRWLKSDFTFQAALNRGKCNLREAVPARLMTIAEECVSKSLKGGNSKTALTVLKGLGLLDGKRPDIDSSDPEELAREPRRMRYIAT
jgi:hypothetical protein